MLPSQHWAREFTVEPQDLDRLINLLLEQETPLTTQQLLRNLIEDRFEQAAAALEERFKDVQLYDPALSYTVGQHLAFPRYDFATAQVTEVRPGNNPDYGEFSVITVDFDEGDQSRQFAAEFVPEHILKRSSDEEMDLGDLGEETLTPEQVIDQFGAAMLAELNASLHENDTLVYLADHWFPLDLLIEVNEGHLNLAEAVLDLAGGGPLTTETILDQIGGLGNAPMSLQIFSLNYGLNEDKRFSEVGPAGEVLWYLDRMMPAEVQNTPSLLLYNPIEYDRSMLSAEMIALEAEICDELSPLETVKGETSGRVTLNYSHRRTGTLPLNANVRGIFPTARSTSHIWITLVDDDGEEYNGWVLPKAGYVYGLGPIYSKYQVPVGAHVTVNASDDPDRVFISLNTYRPRTEWVVVMQPQQDTILFENSKRAIGVGFDDLMLLGIDDLEGIDAVVKDLNQQRKTLAALLRVIIPGLGRLNPQGTAHTKTIYSAINVIRRYPPGPIMAILEANPDFENVGGLYWELAD